MPVAFRILSHAGLLVQSGGKNLVFDPWLVGSAYWRSWWNYPPVPRESIDSLHADFIYLTHIHWDHFHGPSLRKFPRETPILIPKSPSPRMRRDLEAMGFTHVSELRHGQTAELAPDFKLSAYHFHPFTDSAAVVECGGVTLFNANDAKFMGPPLDQILARHPKIDFVFRSHSSANERLCFDYFDAPGRALENNERYLRDFADFTRGTGARYAIPFASNHCYLHKETFHLNSTIVTPAQVEAYCSRARGGAGPRTMAMACGDGWSSEKGFAIVSAPFFAHRERRLARYAASQKEKLERFYALEARTQTSLTQVEAYFRKFIRALPWPARRAFKGKPITFVLTGKNVGRYWVDLHRGVVRELAGVEDGLHPLQVHTSAYIFRRCMALDLFLFLGISKRVLYRCNRADAKYLNLLILLFNLYECGMLPMWKLLSPRFLLAAPPRWREGVLYARILMRALAGKPFRMADFLPKAGAGDNAGEGAPMLTYATETALAKETAEALFPSASAPAYRHRSVRH